MKKITKGIVKAAVALGAIGVVVAMAKKAADRKCAFNDSYEDDGFDECWDEEEDDTAWNCKSSCGCNDCKEKEDDGRKDTE